MKACETLSQDEISKIISRIVEVKMSAIRLKSENFYPCILLDRKEISYFFFLLLFGNVY